MHEGISSAGPDSFNRGTDMGPELKFPFTFEERIEGAIVAVYEGELHIVSRHGKWDDAEWIIDGITLDGKLENPRAGRDREGIIHQPLFLDVDVDLPPTNPLYAKIVIEYAQGRTRHAIDERWALVSRKSNHLAPL